MLKIRVSRLCDLGFPSSRVVELVLLGAWVSSSVANGDLPGDQGNGRHQAGLWRLAENDGLNCLFLQLRSLGYTKPYEAYVKEMAKGARPEDLGSLAVIAKESGYELAPVRLTMAELEGANLPVIVHLEQTDRGTGYFALVAEFTEHDVVVVNGGRATLMPISKDTFRREWSSYGLVPHGRAGGVSVIRRVLAAFLTAVAVAYAGRRIIRRRTKC